MRRRDRAVARVAQQLDCAARRAGHRKAVGADGHAPRAREHQLRLRTAREEPPPPAECHVDRKELAAWPAHAWSDNHKPYH